MPEFVEMPSTMWTAISLARRRGTEALDEILRKYRPPVLEFIRNSGLREAEAEDATQEVFLKLIRDDVLSKAEKERGRFRHLLIAIIRQTVADRWRRERRVKRGGREKIVSMDQEIGDGRLQDLIPAPEQEESFDVLWIENLVRLGMSRLRREHDREGRPHFQALLMLVNEGKTYEEIAAALSVSKGHVRNYIHQARLRLKRHVLGEIREYSSTKSEFEDEVAYLMKYLA